MDLLIQKNSKSKLVCYCRSVAPRTLRRLEAKTMDSVQGCCPRRCPPRVPRWTQQGPSTRVECLLWDQKVERKTSQLLRTTGERLRRLDLPTPVVPPDHYRHSSCPNFGKRSTFDTQRRRSLLSFFARRALHTVHSWSSAQACCSRLESPELRKCVANSAAESSRKCLAGSH